MKDYTVDWDKIVVLFATVVFILGCIGLFMLWGGLR